MKKFFSFMLMALFSAGMFAEGTATTVYYTAPAATIGTYTVKLNVHMGCYDGDDWKQYDMVKTDKTYGEDPIYSASFTDYWNGLCTMQFQLYDGSTWKSQDEVFNSWFSESAYNGKMYVHSLGEWVAADAQPGDALPAPDVVLKGSFDSWGAGYKFTPSDDKKTATLTRNITADSYAFKLTVGGAWYGEGTKVTRENCTDIPFTANTGDAILTADADGDYTFVYTFETKKLSVTFPPAPVNPQPVINYYLIGSFNDWKLETCEPMEGDSIVYEFAAGKTEFKVLPQKTGWNNAKGFASVNAECSSEGLSGNDGDNVIFTLKEKGNVKIKVVEGKLCVTGAFEVPEPQPVVNYYLIGSFNDWKLETCEPMEGDSIVYEFAAGKTEFKVLPQNTKWDNALGFAKVNADCSSEGLSGNDGDNVIFTLKEKGNVKIKVVEGKLCVTGAFEVPEPQPVINYYLVGSMNNWSVENAIPLVGDSLVANVEAGKYECKIIPKDLAQDWSNALGYSAVNAECSSEGIIEGENGNIVVELKEKGDIKIKVVEGKLCITGTFYVPAAPTLTNGFYLIGQKGWDVAALSAELLFAVNPDNQNEYQLNVTLAKDEGIKVVKVENDVIKAWYPDGEGNEYKVDANHVGAKTIYFQETYKEDWKDFGGFIWIDANPETGVVNVADDAKAVKFIENGQLFIRANDTIYTIMGLIVR